jgi:hypothetical protein
MVVGYIANYAISAYLPRKLQSKLGLMFGVATQIYQNGFYQ